MSRRAWAVVLSHGAGVCTFWNHGQGRPVSAWQVQVGVTCTGSIDRTAADLLNDGFVCRADLLPVDSGPADEHDAGALAA